MLNKIIVIIWIFLCVNTSFADSVWYELTSTDKDIINKVESKISIIIYKKSNVTYKEAIFALRKYKNKAKKERTIKIFKKIISDFTIKRNTLTILEWWNIFDIDDYLYSRELIKKWDYIFYVQNKEKIKALSKFFPFLEEQSTLEWYLYPDTYNILPDNFKINDLVITQLEAFEYKVYNILFLNEDKTKKHTNKVIESVVNLSSIVEKEEKNKLEKPTIAWILKKRVKEYWNIWADVTVCYPHSLTSQECKMVISKYIKEKSEYNTRFIIWLPPTPIWNPSYETINATLNHKETDYYYYLHDIQTGKAYYAETNHKHNINKELYLK